MRAEHDAATNEDRRRIDELLRLQRRVRADLNGVRMGPRYRFAVEWESVIYLRVDHGFNGFEKPFYRHVERLSGLGVTLWPDFVINDHDELVSVFGGVHVAPPSFLLDGDSEMLRVYEAIRGHYAELSNRTQHDGDNTHGPDR